MTTGITLASTRNNATPTARPIRAEAYSNGPPIPFGHSTWCAKKTARLTMTPTTAAAMPSHSSGGFAQCMLSDLEVGARHLDHDTAIAQFDLVFLPEDQNAATFVTMISPAQVLGWTHVLHPLDNAVLDDLVRLAFRGRFGRLQ